MIMMIFWIFVVPNVFLNMFQIAPYFIPNLFWDYLKFDMKKNPNL